MRKSGIFFVILFFSFNAYGQVGVNFLKLYQSILKPPADCKKAYEYMNLKDTSFSKTYGQNYFEVKESELISIKTEIENQIKEFKNNINSFKRPDNPVPPSGIGGMPQDNKMIMDDLKKCEKSSEEINFFVKEFKKDIVSIQDSLNKAMKNTLAEDSLSRQIIMNEFLIKLYDRSEDYSKKFETHVSKIEKVISKFGIQEKIDLPFADFKILNIQLSEINGAIFLLRVAKESSRIGSGFYIREEEFR